MLVDLDTLPLLNKDPLASLRFSSPRSNGVPSPELRLAVGGSALPGDNAHDRIDQRPEMLRFTDGPHGGERPNGDAWVRLLDPPSCSYQCGTAGDDIVHQENRSGRQQVSDDRQGAVVIRGL